MNNSHQQSNSTQHSYYTVDLRTFKTKQCSQQHHPIYAPYFYDCPNYHSQLDIRRSPYKNNAQLSQELAYDSNYISDNFDTNSCANWIEHMYHPKIYKTISCQSQNCQRVYCPKVHPNRGQSCNIFNYSYFNFQRYKNTTNNLFSKSMQELTLKIKEIQLLRNNPQKILECGSPELIGLKQKQKDKILKIKKQLHKIDDADKQQKENLKIHIHSLAGANDSLQRQLSTERNYKSFTRGERLDILEDRHHEFKMFKGKQAKQISSMVLEYISAFLNSEGGTIYLGVDDDSFVRGLDVSQKWVDQLLLAIDNDGKKQLSPPLIPQKYQLKLVPVKNNHNLWLNVIQIKVFPQSEKDKKILTLYNRECYLRMNASNHRLSASDIMEYMRLNNNVKFLEAIENYSNNIDQMNMEQLKQFNEKLSKINYKVTNAIRKKQKEKQEGNKNQNQVD